MVKQQAITKIVSTFVKDGKWKVIINLDEFSVGEYKYEEGCGGIHIQLKKKHLYEPISKRTQKKENTLKPMIEYTDYGLKILCCCIDDMETSSPGILVFHILDEVITK